MDTLGFIFSSQHISLLTLSNGNVLEETIKSESNISKYIKNRQIVRCWCSALGREVDMSDKFRARALAGKSDVDRCSTVTAASLAPMAELSISAHYPYACIELDSNKVSFWWQHGMNRLHESKTHEWSVRLFDRDVEMLQELESESNCSVACFLDSDHHEQLSPSHDRVHRKIEQIVSLRLASIKKMLISLQSSKQNNAKQLILLTPYARPTRLMDMMERFFGVVVVPVVVDETTVKKGMSILLTSSAFRPST